MYVNIFSGQFPGGRICARRGRLFRSFAGASASYYVVSPVKKNNQERSFGNNQLYYSWIIINHMPHRSMDSPKFFLSRLMHSNSFLNTAISGRSKITNPCRLIILLFCRSYTFLIIHIYNSGYVICHHTPNKTC